MMRARRRCAALILLLAVSACASFPPAPAATRAAAFAHETLIGIDGARLPLRVWGPDKPRAVVIALHGMNDHAGMFEGPADCWAKDGIRTYAYDQRGFGRAPGRGLWPGAATLRADLNAAVAAAHAAHPGVPVYALGHSMGGAVILSALGAGEPPLAVDGVILAAPAIWGGGELPLLYRGALDLSAAVAPGKTLTGERAARQATDNIEVLRAMAADPLMIRETRIDAALGIVRLMDDALEASRRVAPTAPPMLILMGERDEIIPVDAQKRLAERLTARKELRIDVARYASGWHLLFRDHQRRNVWERVGDFVTVDDGQTPQARMQGEEPAGSGCASG